MGARDRFLIIVFGGLLGFLNSDAWLREVDYHPNEWVAVTKERVVSGNMLRPGLDVNFPGATHGAVRAVTR